VDQYISNGAYPISAPLALVHSYGAFFSGAPLLTYEVLDIMVHTKYISGAPKLLVMAHYWCAISTQDSNGAPNVRHYYQLLVAC
jgi:hypothetical protein